jgi:predicted dehydrogenase
MTKTYRVAILGCRGRGTAAARGYHAHPRTEVIGLCDLVPELLNTLGDELGVDARYDDLDAMIRETAPDIVAIPTGTEFHYDLAMRVLEHGVHIDIEKPLCVELIQADEVIARAAAKGVRIAVHHQGRTGAIIRSLASALEAGRIGELQHIHGYGKGYYGGYGLMNIGTHMINMMLKLAGSCRAISGTAMTAGAPITPDDVVQSPQGMGTITGERLTGLLEFDNGVTATLLHHRYPQRVPPMLELCGSEGRLLAANLLYSSGKPNAMYLPTPHYVPDSQEWQHLEPVFPQGFDRQSGHDVEEHWYVDDYVAALDEGREHECSGAAGLHVLEIMMGLFESVAYGRRVSLPQQDRSHPLLRWRREHGLDDPPSVPRPYNEWLAVEDERLAASSARSAII